MEDAWQTILRISLQGSVLIGAVCVLRLILKKAPKRMLCLLWLLVGLRLLLPFEIQSSVSLQPDYDRIRPMLWMEAENSMNMGPITEEQGQLLTEKPNNQTIPNGQVGAPVGNPLGHETQNHRIPEGNIWNVFPYIWLAGLFAMGMYTVASYRHLKRKVADGIILEEGIWVCSGLDTAFVLGFLRPQIYLPVSLNAHQRQMVLIHEKIHVAHGDHLWKMLGFAALSVHWFNPLVWLAYALLCRDMEMACDEQAVASMTVQQRKEYSLALLACAVKQPMLSACPVAFGEVSVKERVENVMKYKKSGFWIVGIAVLAVIAVAACFLTTPKTDDAETAERLGGHVFTWEKMYADRFSFEIELDEDGTFYLVDGVDPYDTVFGVWNVEDGLLKLRDDGMRKYRYFYFQVDGDDWIYLADQSDPFRYTQVADGDRFCMNQDMGNAEEKLAQCREAFEKWSSYDSYHVKQSNTYAGSILDTASEVDYWKSGDNWLYTMSIPETDGGRMICHLRKDGVAYRQELYETQTDNPQGWPWSVAEETSDCMERNWYKAFDWEKAKIQYVRTDIINTDKERVTLTVLEDPSTFGKYCPYTVHFVSDCEGIPLFVYMTLEENKGERDWSRIDCSYTLCGCEEADAKIEESYVECMAVLGEENGTASNAAG